MAFFPCTRFETLDMLNSRCDKPPLNKYDDCKKLDYSMKHDEERHRNYRLISTMAQIAIRRGLKMVIENPRCNQHYLNIYWPLKPKVIDYNRREHGDRFIKPTQYWFIGFEPKGNMFFEPQEFVEYRSIRHVTGVSHSGGTQREKSEIHPQYARWFIKSYILDITEE